MKISEAARKERWAIETIGDTAPSWNLMAIQVEPQITTVVR